ncbi:autotransporter family protein [Pseudomonas sp. KNUC1026]|uniref:autotransporter family protein n=1 Tax=Pseudomonas sp. KNUC1026 TaxID=2893890 RepID=UPI001F302EF1|nr:autotransporter outer membrane beta-barrel domain-containing protein [Pseudomonas sp. KNUC1026]UFH51091.1 autotransporter outer membrane beta-barrel domain-containing protein [Pseudomonas sp. KNUC1026]
MKEGRTNLSFSDTFGQAAYTFGSTSQRQGCSMDSQYPGQRRQSAFSHPHFSYTLLLAAGALCAEAASAAGSCSGASTTLDGAFSTTCSLGPGEQVSISAQGSLNVQNGPAVSISHPGEGTSSVSNAGSLNGSEGIRLQGTLASGQLYNRTSGQIVGASEALLLDNSRYTGDVRNEGSAQGGTVGARLVDSTLAGFFMNHGTLRGEDAGISLERSSVGYLINNGTIQAHEIGSTGVSINAGRITRELLNNGEIRPGDQGVGLSLSGGTVAEGSVGNTGQITGHKAVYFNDVTVQGQFYNTGRIASTAVDVGGDNGQIAVNMVNSADRWGFCQWFGRQYRKRLPGRFDAPGHDRRRMDQRRRHPGREWRAALSHAHRGQFRHLRQHHSVLPRREPDRQQHRRALDQPRPGQRARSTAREWRGARRLSQQRHAAGGGRGVSLVDGAQVTGGFNNAGLIQGKQYSLYVSDDSQLASLNIAGTGTARFDGAVYAPRTQATLFSNAQYQMKGGDQWQVAGFTQRGTLVLAAPSKRETPAVITGNFRQAAGAVLRTQVLDQTHYGQLKVSGTATLPSQARIDVDVVRADQPFTVARLQGVISAGKLVSDGTFNVSGNSALFDFGAVKNGNAVDLTLQAKSTEGVSQASAAVAGGQGAARVLDAELAKGSASPLAAYFVGATSQAQVASRVAQTLPQGNDSLRASQAMLGDINQALQERLTPAESGLPMGAWSQSFSRLAGRDGGASLGSSGTLVGVDTATGPGTKVGMAFAYANGGSGGLGDGTARGSQSQLWQFTGYRAVTLAPGMQWLSYAGAGRANQQATRSLAFDTFGGQARAEYASQVATLGSSLSQAFALSDSTQLTPSLRLDYNHIRDQGYRERGPASLGPVLLSVQARQSDQLIAGFDTRLDQRLSENGAALRLSLGVGYDLINASNEQVAQFAGAPDSPFKVAGSRASPWLARASLGLSAPLPGGVQLGVSYSAQTRSDYAEQQAQVAISKAW